MFVISRIKKSKNKIEMENSILLKLCVNDKLQVSQLVADGVWNIWLPNFTRNTGLQT